MDSAGTSDERGARSIGAHRLGGARDRRGHRPGTSAVHPGPVKVRQGGESLAEAHETADHRQAEYFLRLLVQNRHHVDHRIGACQKAIALAEAAGDAEGASGLRHVACAEEQERQTLDRLIENLRRRFPARAPGQAARPVRVRA